MTWSAITVQAIGMLIGTGALAPQVELYVGAKLEIDINTTPESSSKVESIELSSIFDELTQLGLEIAEKGDLPR